jgi:glycosyltransferase involved in cell wall biosynthesis
VSPQFSVVYPTRHRPEFVRQALRVLELQPASDFEVVVSDNFEDPALSCEQACRDTTLPSVRYVRPPRPVGMVENWNHALPHATGDYVCFLTDKTFLLPGALDRIGRAIGQARRPDLVSWTSDAYNPARSEDLFGDGTYYNHSPEARGRGLFRRFSAGKELDRRGRAEVSRKEQTPQEYTRGKLAFGAYRRELIQRIVDRFGTLFHNINPDYTSMVLGLTEARSAIEMRDSCVVSVNTDLSNGRITDENDRAMYEFLDGLDGGIGAILPDLLVPGVYASQHNGVAHDYLWLRRRFGLRFAWEPTAWLAYIHEDIHRPARRWSSPQVEAEQKGLLAAFLAADPRVDAAVRARLAAREEARHAPPKRPPAPIRVGRRWYLRFRPEVTPPERLPASYGSLETALASRFGGAPAPA